MAGTDCAVAVDVRRMGLEAGRVLLEALSAVKNGKSIAPMTQMVDYQITERGSTRSGSAL